MTPEQRTKQMQAIHIQYSQMVRDGILPADRDCHLWASEILGRIVPTLKACEDHELNALRDRLQGKDGKLLSRVLQEFERCGIKNPNAWVASLAKGDRFQRWRNCTLETLPISQLYRCLKMLERRSNGARPKPERRGAVRVQSEQQQLWGM